MVAHTLQYEMTMNDFAQRIALFVLTENLVIHTKRFAACHATSWGSSAWSLADAILSVGQDVDGDPLGGELRTTLGHLKVMLHRTTWPTPGVDSADLYEIAGHAAEAAAEVLRLLRARHGVY